MSRIWAIAFRTGASEQVKCDCAATGSAQDVEKIFANAVTHRASEFLAVIGHGAATHVTADDSQLGWLAVIGPALEVSLLGLAASIVGAFRFHRDIVTYDSVLPQVVRVRSAESEGLGQIACVLACFDNALTTRRSEIDVWQIHCVPTVSGIDL